MAHSLATDMGENGALASAATTWSTAASAEMYRLADWGQPYFFINSGGHVAVRTDSDAPGAVDLANLAAEARRRQIEFPLLVRFPEILGSRVRALHREFRSALVRSGYGNAYQALYPVKVNPLQSVVSEILAAGRESGMGFECGSKAELVAALAHLRDARTLLVCNGVKDENMLELLVDAQRLGRNAIPVVERPEELAALESVASKRRVAPTLGVRIRLTGADSRFGLDAAELVELLERLESSGALCRLTLLHCHPGSQITDLAKLQDAVREAAQVYASLVRRGAALRYLDVGGGLGVDYGESGGDGESKLNYTMGDYAETIAATIQAVCRASRVPVPVLVTESGRAITAHHAVLIVPVLAVRERSGFMAGTPLPPAACEATGMLVGLARRGPELREASEALALLAHVDRSHGEVATSFANGRLPLEERAVADRAYVTVCRRLLRSLRNAGVEPPSWTRGLVNSLADRILCDFSVFQSMPDHWAIGQTFPVMPIDRLDECPSRRGILVDVTCDADGRVNRYVSSHPDRSVLPVHPPCPDAPTYLAFFLMGAYEDVIGSNHNLLGRVSEVLVRADANRAEGLRIEKTVAADSVAGVLGQVGYAAAELEQSMRESAAAGIGAGALSRESARGMVDRYAACLREGTYCEAGPTPASDTASEPASEPASDTDSAP